MELKKDYLRSKNERTFGLDCTSPLKERATAPASFGGKQLLRLQHGGARDKSLCRNDAQPDLRNLLMMTGFL